MINFVLVISGLNVEKIINNNKLLLVYRTIWKTFKRKFAFSEEDLCDVHITSHSSHPPSTILFLIVQISKQ